MLTASVILLIKECPVDKVSRNVIFKACFPCFFDYSAITLSRNLRVGERGIKVPENTELME